MKKNRLFLILLLLALVAALFGCSNKKSSPDGTLSGNPSFSTPQSTEEVIALIKTNSSLKTMPGDTYDSVDTDGFTLLESNGKYVFSNDIIGLEYTFSGAGSVEECTLFSVKINAPGYAVFGITVGGRIDDAQIVLTSYGFDKEKSEDICVFSLNGIKLTFGCDKQEILFISIGK